MQPEELLKLYINSPYLKKDWMVELVKEVYEQGRRHGVEEALWKIPPPIIAPTLMATALHRPIERFSFRVSCFFTETTAKQNSSGLPIKTLQIVKSNTIEWESFNLKYDYIICGLENAYKKCWNKRASCDS